jgi:hypothetical protein
MAGFRPNYYYSSPQFASIGQNIGSIFGGASPEDQARANLILSQIRENEAQTGKTSYETERLRNEDAAIGRLGDLFNKPGPVGDVVRGAYANWIAAGQDPSKIGEFMRGYGLQSGDVPLNSDLGSAFVVGGGGTFADGAQGFYADQARQERDSVRDDNTARYGHELDLDGTKYTADSKARTDRYATDVDSFVRRSLGILGEETDRRGQDIQAGVDMRGQDITSADTRLGDRMTDWRERQKFITANELEREKNEALDKREREKLEIERTKPFTANVNERVYGRTADGGIGMLFDADPSARTITAADGAIVADAAGNKILENPKDPVGGKGTKTTLDANGNVVVEPVEAVKTPDLDDFLKAVSIQLGALSADGALGGLDVPPEALSAVAARAAEIATSGVPAPAAINQAIKEMVVSNPAVDNWGPSNTPPSVGLRAAPAAPAVQGGDAPPVNDDPPPPAALSRLREGYASKFENGQVWTLQNGKPVRVK